MPLSNPTLAAIAEVTTIFFLSGLAATRFTDAHSSYVSTDPAKRVTLTGNIVGGVLYVVGIVFMMVLIVLMYENNCEKEKQGLVSKDPRSRMDQFKKRTNSSKHTDGDEDLD